MEHFKRLPIKYETNTNDYKTGIEVDAIISQYKGIPIKVAVEVNGVFHYSRNSEATLGRDRIKKMILEK